MTATAPRARSTRALRLCACATALAIAGSAATLFAGSDFERMGALASKRFGAPAAAAVRAWGEAIAAAKALPERERLTRINKFFNDRIAFGSDDEIWGEKDYWATPLETLGKGRGDCEDFSVAKYATLLLAGVPVDRLRLVYVKAQIGGPRSRVTQAHMVLAYYATAQAEPLILDNLLPEVVPASRRPDLSPVFSFNSAGLWVGSATQATDKKPERRLSHWAGVLKRMHDEGLR
jgi:predicted transglutaminase-like cysteine proteinase